MWNITETYLYARDKMNIFEQKEIRNTAKKKKIWRDIAI